MTAPDAGSSAARALPDIAARVVAWQAGHGRHTLPWQNTRDPYCVWLSEVMLQQTQVATVLTYYTRFLEHFPDVQALAAAPADEVLALWSGLGYYSRARNLHRCAQAVVSQHGGAFPRTVRELAALPGIGRSTAGAIAAFCFSKRAPILDANVRRVLTRVLAFGADLATAAGERALWGCAEALLPDDNLQHAMPRYTQGLMDLGAGICLPRNPSCMLCPLNEVCLARQQGQPERYPVRTRKLQRSAQTWWLALQRDALGCVWLERRPDTGIWAGLYCPPVFNSRQALLEASAGPVASLADADVQELPAFLHVLTHRDLHLHPVLVRVSQACPAEAGAAGDGRPAGGWFSPGQWRGMGLPAPVRALLERLPELQENQKT